MLNAAMLAGYALLSLVSGARLSLYCCMGEEADEGILLVTASFGSKTVCWQSRQSFGQVTCSSEILSGLADLDVGTRDTQSAG
jgi:hypothetical protein